MRTLQLALATILVSSTLRAVEASRYRIPGRAPGDRLGFAMATLGDVDGDGVPDFAAASMNAAEEAQGGRVDIFSGKDGKVLRSWFGQERGDWIGWLLASAPDLDSDGDPELALGLAGGKVSIVSPVTGDEWYAMEIATTDGVYWGRYLIVDDADGDGIRDYVCASGLVSVGALSRAGEVALRSGRRGTLIWKRSGTVALGNLGSAVAPVGDQDSDGLTDVAVGEPCHRWRPGDEGVPEGGFPAVHVISLRTGDILRTLRPEGPGAHFEFGAGLVAIQDRQTRGLVRLAIAAPSWGEVADPLEDGGALGWVGVYSLPALRLEREWKGLRARRFLYSGDLFGYRLKSAGDADGDGTTDLLVGNRGLDFRPGYGRLEVYSGRTLELLETKEGFQEEEAFFATLDSLGDVDGDGRDEFLVGTSSEDEADAAGWNAPQAGAIRLLGHTPFGARFRRGDVNRDGRINITDPIALWMSLTGREPLGCAAACDADADGRVDILDIHILLEHLFTPFGPLLAPPYRACSAYARLSGAPNSLDCADTTPCQ